MSCLLIINRKESCCNKLKKSGLVKTEILYKLKVSKQGGIEDAAVGYREKQIEQWLQDDGR